jgi:multidrug efflux pump subunit AcrA (membrane-fusion protein)
MRYDGYYVLADWLEIPNLRERSNRFLMNLFLETCLGIETIPEPYMQLGRRILFVSYAIFSYIYRWVVTFSILYFMDSFLKPYKLEVISHMLALAALGSMIGWPIYRLGKNLHRRGRLPDMKRWRVVTTTAVAAAIIFFVCLVPVPIGRIRGQALIQPIPDESASVFLVHSGILEKLMVRPGQHVEPGDELARFSNRETQAEMDTALADAETRANHIEVLRRALEQTTEEKERLRIQSEIVQTRGELDSAKVKAANYERVQAQDLVIRAPRSGTVGTAPRIEDIGRYYEADPTTPFCTINEPGRLRVCLPVVTPEFNELKKNLEKPSGAVELARRRLRMPVTISYQNTPLSEVLKDLSSKTKGQVLALDNPTGAEANLTVTAEMKKVPLAMTLARILEPLGMGYYVYSDEGDDRDGQILLRPGRERGRAEDREQKTKLDVTIRVQGRDSHTWRGELSRLPESEAKEIPLPLSNRGGGPVAVKAGGPPGHLIPQTQHYLVNIDLLVQPGETTIPPGSMAQVKIHCRSETCLHWAWRTINTTFDLGLL